MTALVLVEGSATRWRVRCADAALSLDRSRGGAATLSHGTARVDLGLRVVLADGTEAGQQNDPDALVRPIEQGPGLAGVRVEFGLYAGGSHAGDGFTEYWLAAGGRLLVSAGVRVLEAHVAHAGLVAVAPGQWATDGPGDEHGTEVVLCRPDGLAAGVEWSSVVYRAASAIEWVRTRPPFYRRWMSYMDQWSLDPATEGFDREDSAGASVHATGEATTVDLAWRRSRGATAGSSPAPGSTPGQPAGLTARGALLVAVGREQDVRASLQARREPLAVTSDGAPPAFHQAVDGTVAIAASGARTVVTLPADRLERPVHLRVDGLSGRGGVRVRSIAAADLAIVSGRDGVDDPLVALEPPFRGRADQAVVSARARADAPVEVEVAEVEGLHAAVQRLDPDRRITVHHPDDPDAPVLEISTTRLRLTALRLPGRDVALHDVPLHWLRYLAKSAAHVTERPAVVAVEDWGPEQVVVRLDGTNADGTVASSYRLVVPYRRDRVEVAVEATLRGGSRWGLDCAEYADVFPEVGVDPTRWRYRTAVLVRAAGNHVIDLADPYPGLDAVVNPPVHALEAFRARVDHGSFGPWRMEPGDAVVLHGAEAGDVAVILDGAVPGDLGHVATYCEHWADVHLDVVRGGGFPTPSELPPGAPTLLPDDVAARYRLVVGEPAMDVDGAVATLLDI